MLKGLKQIHDDPFQGLLFFHLQFLFVQKCLDELVKPISLHLVVIQENAVASANL